jgi:AhpD family alkylhydroperoxidase
LSYVATVAGATESEGNQNGGPKPHSTGESRPRATGKTKRLFRDVKARFGGVPNLFRAPGNSSAALESYLNFGNALGNGTFDHKVRTRIGLTVAESNLCGYCLSAHLFMSSRTDLTQKEVADPIRACADSGRVDGILKLARSIVIQPGEITDSDFQQARTAGLTDGEIVETVANVVHNAFMN